MANLYSPMPKCVRTTMLHDASYKCAGMQSYPVNPVLTNELSYCIAMVYLQKMGSISSTEIEPLF